MGSLRVFFQARGVFGRGDPISPYLFLLVMEAFSAMLHQKFASGSITFHPKCAAINLSHLIFANDMIILCGANVNTFQSIHEHLQDFYSLSGLQPNLNKSACFFAGVEENQKSVLKMVLNIPEASFPVTYLGVPLISTKLRSADCIILKERILRRIQSWSNNFCLLEEECNS